jgi:hypothetical protein
MATHDPPDEWRQRNAEDRAAQYRASRVRRGCAVIHAASSGQPQGCSTHGPPQRAGLFIVLAAYRERTTQCAPANLLDGVEGFC